MDDRKEDTNTDSFEVTLDVEYGEGGPNVPTLDSTNATFSLPPTKSFEMTCIRRDALLGCAVVTNDSGFRFYLVPADWVETKDDEDEPMPSILPEPRYD